MSGGGAYLLMKPASTDGKRASNPEPASVRG